MPEGRQHHSFPLMPVAPLPSSPGWAAGGVAGDCILLPTRLPRADAIEGGRDADCGGAMQ